MTPPADFPIDSIGNSADNKGGIDPDPNCHRMVRVPKG
jgi:hypothetical protein